MKTTATDDIDTTSTGSADPATSSTSEKGMDPAARQQVSSASPTRAEEEAEDSDSNSNSNSNSSSAENVNMVGQRVWLVVWDSHVETNERGFSIVQSVHSTRAKATAAAKQVVREHPLGDPFDGEWLDEDDPRNAAAAKPFLDDPENWTIVEDETGVQLGMGYQYERFRSLRVVVWIDERKVE